MTDKGIGSQTGGSFHTRKRDVGTLRDGLESPPNEEDLFNRLFAPLVNTADHNRQTAHVYRAISASDPFHESSHYLQRLFLAVVVGDKRRALLAINLFRNALELERSLEDIEAARQSTNVQAVPLFELIAQFNY